MNLAQRLTRDKFLRARLVVALSDLAFPQGGDTMILRYYSRLLQELVDHVMCDSEINQLKLDETFRALGIQVSFEEPKEIKIRNTGIERNG